MRSRRERRKSKSLTLLAVGIAVCASTLMAPSSHGTTLSASHETILTVGLPGSDPLGDLKQGQVYASQLKYKKAIEAFNKAETKGLRPYELFVFRGFAYHGAKQFDKAKQDAEKALEMDPSKVLGYELLAGVHYGMGNGEAAIKELTNGLTKVEEADRARLIKVRGIMLLELGRREEAISDLSRAEELGYAKASLYYNRGWAYMELGRYELAIEDFSEALTRDPRHYRGLRDRGWVYGCIGQFQKAIDDFNQVLTIDPHDVVAYGMRGYVRLEAGDGEGSLADFVYALKHGSKDPWTFLNAAATYYAHDKMAKALEVNKQGLAFVSNDPESESALQFQRGLFFLVSGKTKEATRWYDQAKALALKRSERLQLQEAIGDLKGEIQSRPGIANVAATIVKELESAVAQTGTSAEPASSLCQRLRKRENSSP